MTYQPPKCDACSSRKSVAKSYRLDPKTWTERFRVLCPVCRTKLRYTVVNHDRPYANLKANEHMRGAR